MISPNLTFYPSLILNSLLVSTIITIVDPKLNLPIS